jgi:hypothetical protein
MSRRKRPLPAPEVTRSRQVLFAAALTLAICGVLLGCGDRRLHLKVDVHSFLDSSETTANYGPVPPGQSLRLTLSQDANVNLLAGVGGVVDVERLEFSVRGIFDNATGSGQGTICVFFARPGQAPVDSLQFPLDLAPGRADTLETLVVGSDELARLFSEESLELTVQLDFLADGPPTNLDPLAGRFELTHLVTLLTTRREMD